MHKTIGIQLRRLLESNNDSLPSLGSKTDGILLLIAYHLNKGIKLSDHDLDVDTCIDLAGLNYQAGLDAFNRTTFYVALEYLEFGRKLLAPLDIGESSTT